MHSGGSYAWQSPPGYYKFNEAFKTEIGSISVPTLEAIHAMMPKKDWESIDDDWAEHDLAWGNQHGELYPGQLNGRYGPALDLADFVRKAQLMNYEAFRAMYEGRFDSEKLLGPLQSMGLENGNMSDRRIGRHRLIVQSHLDIRIVHCDDINVPSIKDQERLVALEIVCRCLNGQ